MNNVLTRAFTHEIRLDDFESYHQGLHILIRFLKVNLLLRNTTGTFFPDHFCIMREILFVFYFRKTKDQDEENRRKHSPDESEAFFD